jgi:hypothetical protein
MKKLALDSSPADVTFAATWAGSIGGAAVALFFLILDIVAGHALQTPSILASAVFLGEIPAGSEVLRLELVALYSLVHFVAFTAVGAAFAWIVVHTADVAAQSVIVSAGLFATLTAGVLAVDLTIAPGLGATIGLIPICLGNVLAAGAMFAFYRSVLGVPAGDAVPHA